MVDGDCVESAEPCENCKDLTLHHSRCTGGVKLKPYVCSYDGRDWSGDIEVMNTTATYGDGTPVVDHSTGVAVHDQAKYRSDARAERRERLRSQANKKRGKTPLFFG